MHWLTVPEDPAAALQVSHIDLCRRRVVRPAGAPAATPSPLMSVSWLCMVGQMISRFGIETWFCRIGNEDDGYASEGRISLAPGVYAIGYEHIKTVHGVDGAPRASVAALRLMADDRPAA